MTITNETSEDITVFVEVTTVDGGDTIVSETILLGLAEEKVYDEITDSEETRILVRVQNGPEIERSFSDSSYDDQDIWFLIYSDRIDVIRGSA